MNDSSHLHSPPRVAYQGARGAFSEEAAAKLLGDDATLVPCRTFETLFASIEEGIADLILAPLENSLAGSVHRSYDLLLASSLHIIAEVVLPIRHCLIGCPGAAFESLTTIASHPVALAQCERFFAAHPQLKPVVADDTAGSVADAMHQGDPTHAAIASARAAHIYGGVVLRENLEDYAENFTRFVLLAPAPCIDERADRLSLVVKLRHQPGALLHALSPFAKRGINLLKIESRPVPRSPWQYHFYLDLQISLSEPESNAALAELRRCADDVRLLGCYRAARTFT